MNRVQDSPPVRTQEHNQMDHALQPFDDFLNYVREYARERPEVTVFTCLAVGFILGWRLKPW